LSDGADSGSARLLAASPRAQAKLHGMDHPPHSSSPPSPDDLSSEARGLFAAGWYATRDEGRVVHPAEQTEQVVSRETWRALRELASSAPVRAALQASS
jgi:hypothetical protein